VTYYRWRQEFGGLKGDQVKRLKELEAENTLPSSAYQSARRAVLGQHRWTQRKIPTTADDEAALTADI
jgi:hypothetical protein